MAKYKIIANPCTRHGKGTRAIPKIEPELRGLNLDSSNGVCTQSPLHSLELIRQAEVIFTKEIGA